MLLIRNRALLTLFLAQALYWSCSLIGSALVGPSGQSQIHFLVCSLLLGIGCNLMLIAGTTLLARPATKATVAG